MLHAYVERFDVICVRENILGWEGEVNKALYIVLQEQVWSWSNNEFSN
jgi:hypothetical protein